MGSVMRIPARFNGPPGSGNGGWSAGAFARAAGATVGGPPFEVTLRLPPPLDTDVSVTPGAAGEPVQIRQPDGALVAQVAAAQDAGAGVDPVEPAVAADAARAYPGFAAHPFPTCYVCGPARPDGLRIFPGLLPDGRTAAPWLVPDDVDFPTVWAALDCPGGWSALHTGRTYLLGRITALVTALPRPGASCVVVGAATAVAGRKALVESSLYAPDGACLATARATWIAPT
jgi:hypothetical protein